MATAWGRSRSWDTSARSRSGRCATCRATRRSRDGAGDTAPARSWSRRAERAAFPEHVEGPGDRLLRALRAPWARRSDAADGERDHVVDLQGLVDEEGLAVGGADER